MKPPTRWALPEISPGTLGALGCFAGALVAWSLAGTEFYLLWTLATALGLCLCARAGASAVQNVWQGAGQFLCEAAGLLVTVAWLRGPSPLALFTAFWAFRFFVTIKPLGLRSPMFPGAEAGPRMAGFAPAIWAFGMVMLPLRLLVNVPWAANAAFH